MLVHGAWVGEWCWDPIVPLLQAAGREVHAVSLRGHGARRAESGPHVTLADHVQDVTEVIEAFDLHDVTLVGHSYGGRVITRVWERVPGRIGRLVYLDAHAPVGAVDAEPFPVDVQGMIPFADISPVPGEDGSRLVAHSARTLEEPFWVDLPRGVDVTYVHATGEPSPRFRAYAAAARAEPSWRTIDIAGTHWLMYTHPREVAAVILDPEHATTDEPSEGPWTTTASAAPTPAACRGPMT